MRRRYFRLLPTLDLKRGKLSRSFARVVLPDLRLVVQNDVQQRVTDFQFSVVFDIAQFAELVHEKVTRDRVVPIISARVS